MYKQDNIFPLFKERYRPDQLNPNGSIKFPQIEEEEVEESETSESVVEQQTSDNFNDSKYSYIEEGAGIGYYTYSKDGSIQISDFYINLNRWVKTKRDGEPLSYFEGEVMTKDGSSIKIDRLTASTLDDSLAFKKYIGNLCGLKAIMMGSPSDVVKAIKTLNQDVEEYEEHEFGYNSEKDSYYTSDLVITADRITQQKTPIKYSENWGNNKLGFKNIPKKEVQYIKDIIINKLFLWEDPIIMLNSLAFTFYPLIYKLLKDKNPNKFYLMLKGPSGSGNYGKILLMERFPGNCLF